MSLPLAADFEAMPGTMRVGYATTLFATVSGVDAAAKHMLLDDGDTIAYDTLVLTGGAHHGIAQI